MKTASFDNREWIDPWRDRRPMTTDPVLVSIVENGENVVAIGVYNAEVVDHGTFTIDIGWRVDGFHMHEVVLAWKPLEEPFNPAEEDANED